MYFTGTRYAQFIRTIIAQKANEESGDLRYIIFQDDQDRKQRAQVALDTVDHVFYNRIEPKDCAVKLADVWPIENVWSISKEKLRDDNIMILNISKMILKANGLNSACLYVDG